MYGYITVLKKARGGACVNLTVNLCTPTLLISPSGYRGSVHVRKGYLSTQIQIYIGMKRSSFTLYSPLQIVHDVFFSGMKHKRKED